MKSRSAFLIAILALTTLGGAAFSWMQYQELIELRAAALNRGDADLLNERLADDQKRIKALSDQLAALRAPEGAPVAGDASVAPNGPGGQRGQIDFGAIRNLMNNPEFMKLALIQGKAMLDTTYAALFKSLNLTPQQLDQFKDMLVQKQQAIVDAQMAAQQQGINPRTDPQGFQQAIAQASAAADAQIQAALGDAGFSQYQQYQQTLPQRNTVNQLQQSLSYTQNPLSDDQAGQLIQIMAQDAPQRGGNAGLGAGGFAGLGAGGFAGLGPGPSAPITAQAITLAQGLLSAPQLQALQQLQQQQQTQQQLQQLMRAGGAGGAPGGGRG